MLLFGRDVQSRLKLPRRQLRVTVMCLMQAAIMQPLQLEFGDSRARSRGPFNGPGNLAGARAAGASEAPPGIWSGYVIMIPP
jgi:hypothetical protein